MSSTTVTWLHDLSRNTWLVQDH